MEMVEITGECPEEFFTWLEEMMNSKRISEEDLEMLKRVDIRVRTCH